MFEANDLKFAPASTILCMVQADCLGLTVAQSCQQVNNPTLMHHPNNTCSEVSYIKFKTAVKTNIELRNNVQKLTSIMSVLI